MTGFLVLGGVGVALLVLTLLVGDVFESLNHFELLGGGACSMASVASFIGALGFVGAIIDETTHNLTGAVIGGVLAGLVVGVLVGWATATLRDKGEGSAPSTSSLVGREAQVISAVPAGGYGEIRLSTGEPLKLNARCDQPLAAGERVWVSEVLSATSVRVHGIDALPVRGATETP